MTASKSLYNQLVEALEAAQNGLKWYQKEHPEDASDADNEMHEQIEQLLTALKAHGEKVDVELLKASLTPDTQGAFEYLDYAKNFRKKYKKPIQHVHYEAASAHLEFMEGGE